MTTTNISASSGYGDQFICFTVDAEYKSKLSVNYGYLSDEQRVALVKAMTCAEEKSICSAIEVLGSVFQRVTVEYNHPTIAERYAEIKANKEKTE